MLENSFRWFKITFTCIFFYYTQRLKQFALTYAKLSLAFLLFCIDTFLDWLKIFAIIVVDIDAEINVYWLITALTDDRPLTHTFLEELVLRTSSLIFHLLDLMLSCKSFGMLFDWLLI